MRVAIGLGSSLGDRFAAIELAVRKLDAHPGLSLMSASRLYRSPPMRGGSARGWFVNAVALFASELSVDDLLGVCRHIEDTAGRRRARHWGDRPIDLDVLLADAVVREDRALTLPHPGIADRAFVRVPLREVWPDAVDPRTGIRWRDLPPAPGPRPAPVGVLARPRAPMYLGAHLPACT